MTYRDLCSTQEVPEVSRLVRTGAYSHGLYMLLYPESGGGRLQKFARTPCCLEVVGSSDVCQHDGHDECPPHPKLVVLWESTGACHQPEVKAGPQSSLISPEGYSGTMDATCNFTIVTHHCVVGVYVCSLCEKAVILVKCGVTYGINLFVHT